MTSVNEFLKKHRQHSDDIDFEETLQIFMDDMEKGLNGEESSLMMIPTYLAADSSIELNKKVVAIDAGGSNLRLAKVSFNENGYEVTDFTATKMLGVERAINREEFLDQMSDLILPYLDDCDMIGFCFSFACEITPDKDGKILSFSKEIKIEGCIGMLLAEELKKVLKAKGVEKELHFAILNDTVSTLLGGPVTDNCDGQIGFILGTGTNTAYVEKTANIHKISHNTETMIINMESGGFSKVCIGDIDDKIDKESNAPGAAIMEKKISGGYLGKVIRETVIAAYNEGFFSRKCPFPALPHFNMSTVSQFLDDPYGDNILANCCVCKEDTEMLLEFVDNALDRAAKLVAVNLLGIMVKADYGKKAPCQIVVEGSTFHKCLPLQNKIVDYLDKYGINKYGIQYQFVQGDDVNLIGSAKAILCNK